jgi:hypothetical protein
VVRPNPAGVSRGCDALPVGILLALSDSYVGRVAIDQMTGEAVLRINKLCSRRWTATPVEPGWAVQVGGDKPVTVRLLDGAKAGSTATGRFTGPFWGDSRLKRLAGRLRPGHRALLRGVTSFTQPRG